MSKWEKGARVLSAGEAIEAILGGYVLFHVDKAQNAGWLQNWSISQIRREVMGGRLFHAKMKPEEQ